MSIEPRADNGGFVLGVVKYQDTPARRHVRKSPGVEERLAKDQDKGDAKRGCTWLMENCPRQPCSASARAANQSMPLQAAVAH